MSIETAKRTPRRQKWSLAQHRAVGARLRQAQDELTRLVVEIGNTQGVTARASRLAQKADAALSALRCELDNVLFRDVSACEEKDLMNVYYGHAGRAPEE